MVFIGTAGWSLPKPAAQRFPEQGSSLTRYAAVFDGVEVNSSFYRRHKADTWARWADSVPDDFRFAVKAPKTITHEKRLEGIKAELDDFLADIGHLGDKLGTVLLQLPPSLVFDETRANTFLECLIARHSGQIVIEPRHRSWGTEVASALLREHGVTRVLADPEAVPFERQPGEFLYLRLHGSPRIYYSHYEREALEGYARLLEAAPDDSWCIFDNTASGAAIVNALDLLELAQKEGRSSR